MNGKGKLLKIYIGECDSYHHIAMYHAIIKKVKEQGMAGATTVRGIEGYGASSQIHSTRILRLSEDLPIVIEVVDYEEKINALVDVIKDMVVSGVMITMQDVEIIRYTKAITE
jgi:PII-like signaling protein